MFNGFHYPLTPKGKSTLNPKAKSPTIRSTGEENPMRFA